MFKKNNSTPVVVVGGLGLWDQGRSRVSQGEHGRQIFGGPQDEALGEALGLLEDQTALLCGAL